MTSENAKNSLSSMTRSLVSNLQLPISSGLVSTFKKTTNLLCHRASVKIHSSQFTAFEQLEFSGLLLVWKAFAKTFMELKGISILKGTCTIMHYHRVITFRWHFPMQSLGSCSLSLLPPSPSIHFTQSADFCWRMDSSRNRSEDHQRI